MSFTINSLTLSGNRSSYAVGVDALGNATIVPVNGGTETTGATIGAIQFSDVTMYVLNNTQASVALLYEAALGREPDTAGLENWVNIYNNLPASVQVGGVYQSLAETSGGFNGSMSIADGFVNSAEFQAKYGTLTNAQYVTQLYANVLHRTPDAGGMDTWMAALTPTGQTYTDPNTGETFAGQGQSRAYVLVGFAESNENIADTAAAAATTSASGWLINTSNGGYADSNPAVQMSPTTVLTQGESTGVINTALISPADINSSTKVTVGGETITGTGYHNGGGVVIVNTIQVKDQGVTVYLSNNVPSAGLSNNNDVVYGPVAGGGTIYTDGVSSGQSVHLSGNSNVVGVGGAGPATNPVTVYGFNGTDSLKYNATEQPVAQILTGPVDGHNLNFHVDPSLSNPTGINQSFAINLGNVGDGSAASVAAAANKAYTVADVPYESIVFFGETNSGNVAVWHWTEATTTNNNNQIDFTKVGADVNGNHSIDVNEFSASTILVGVQASTLTASNFH